MLYVDDCDYNLTFGGQEPGAAGKTRTRHYRGRWCRLVGPEADLRLLREECNRLIRDGRLRCVFTQTIKEDKRFLPFCYANRKARAAVMRLGARRCRALRFGTADWELAFLRKPSERAQAWRGLSSAPAPTVSSGPCLTRADLVALAVRPAAPSLPPPPPPPAPPAPVSKRPVVAEWEQVPLVRKYHTTAAGYDGYTVFGWKTLGEWGEAST